MDKLPELTLKRDKCGRFFSHDDLSGDGIYRMVTPDSDVRQESWEILCGKCAVDNVNK